jgi:hypothetical protein
MEAGNVVPKRTIRFIVVAAMALSGVVSARAPAASKRASERMRKSLMALLTRAEAPPAKGKPSPTLRTTFTDAELNAWLAQDGKENVPAGLVSPRVTFTGPGKLTIRGVVDLDAVRKSRERGWLDPFAYLNGLMTISLNAALNGANGQGVFDVESATLGNVSVPKVFLQELITYYSRSPQFPDGVTLTKPFPLPAGVRDLAIQRGTATVVQ